LARPPGPKEAVHLKLEGMDCAALVGLPNLKTTPKGSHEHDHIPAALLFPVRHRVRKTLRQALQRAYKVYVADVRALARKRAAKQARDAHATPHPKASGIVSASPGRSTRR
jgi:ribosomal protein L23